MKKPLFRAAVTIPVVVTDVLTRGEAAPEPWICAIVAVDTHGATSSFTMVPVPVALEAVAPVRLVTVDGEGLVRFRCGGRR